MSDRAHRLLPGVIVIILVLLSAHSVCAFQFDCGCLPPGLGGIDHCNVHVATTPNCPWCTGGLTRVAWVGTVIMIPILWMLRRAQKRELTIGASVTLGLAGYLVGALAAGLLAALVTGYPTWLGFSLR